MVTLALPVLVSVTVFVLLLPIFTAPKSTLAGLAETVSVLTPLPERDTVVGELVAVLTMKMLPLAAPLAAGVKVALNVMLWPGVSADGSVRPLIVNPAPVTLP